MFILPLTAATIGTSHVGEDLNTFYVDQEFTAHTPPDRAYTGFLFASTGGFTFDYRGSFLDEGVSVFWCKKMIHFPQLRFLPVTTPNLLSTPTILYPQISFWVL